MRLGKTYKNTSKGRSKIPAKRGTHKPRSRIGEVDYVIPTNTPKIRIGKTYKNTSKGRSEIPAKPGTYNLRSRNGEVIYTGSTNNLKRRIKEHHYDRSSRFSYVTLSKARTKKQAKSIEMKRLKRSNSILN